MNIIKQIRSVIPVKVRPPHCPYPLYLRRGSSDSAVYEQVFTLKEFDLLDNIGNVRMIVDCGGYTGISAAWFLNQFNQARSIVLEPDRKNFAFCAKNLRPYKNRVTLINAAVWPQDILLEEGKDRFRDGREWTRHYRKPSNGSGGTVQGISLSSLFKKYMLDEVDILKIDIEGSEKELFGSDTAWISSVRNIAIELHDESCKDVFFRAMRFYSYELVTKGDLTLCLGIKG